MGIRMQNNKRNELENAISDFQSESPCKGAHRFTSQNDLCCFL